MSFFAYFLGFLAILILIGIAYEAFSALRDRQRYKQHLGDFVDVGGYKLHYQIQGERKAGQPLVVLEAGIGQNILDWQKIQPQIAEFTQVIAYDRAGYGWSEKGQDPRSPQRLVEDLHKLLHNAQLEPPYLLVGHRFGGIFIRLFADTYPDEVAGIILVESSHPDVVNKEDNKGEVARLQRNNLFFQPIGLVRWVTRRSYRVLELDPAAKEQYLALMMLDNPNLVREAKPLFTEGIELSEEVKIPLTVVSRAEDEDLARERKWSEFQRDLARLSPQAKHIHAESGSNWLLFAEPETVVKAVKAMFDEV
jgi:pimeloyl-ACP methyl ester carboxylesterase